MKFHSGTYWMGILIVPLVFLTMYVWEFWLEESTVIGLSDRASAEDIATHWEFVITATVSSFVSWLFLIPFFRDLNARHGRAEAALRASESQLAQSQKMEALGQLTSGVAHDFNNLLGVILASAEMLEADVKDEDQRGLAKMIQTAADRGAKLVDDLLAFGRRQRLEPTIVSVEKLLDGVNSLLRQILGGQMSIEVVQAADLWKVLVDPARLESALVNLAINARDAMPNGGHLTIETSNASIDETNSAVYGDLTPGQYVLIRVSDTGTGMSPAVAARVFEPFFTTKEVGTGTGLGLSMVHGFVKQSGGHIDIYSELEVGTAFNIYLPRALETGASDETKITRDRDEPTGDKTILMVEDDDLVSKHVERMLETLGYRVLVARGASGAMQILERGDPVDLLFADVVLPGGMSGPQLGAKAAALRPSLPILYTSGYTQNVTTKHGTQGESFPLLKKPYHRRELATKLRELLGPADHGSTVT